MTSSASPSLLVVAALALAACGGTIAGVDSSGTTSSSGSGSTTSSSGTGASTTSSSSSSSSSTSSSSSGVGGGPCAGSVDLVVGNGAPHHLTADCASDTWNPSNATTAVGYLTEGGPPPGVSILHVFGCASGAPNSVGIAVSADGVSGPGAFTSSTLTYTDGEGAAWSNAGSFTVTVTKLGAVGDTIEGKLSAAVIHPPSQIAQMVEATFTTCHIGDQLVP